MVVRVLLVPVNGVEPELIGGVRDIVESSLGMGFRVLSSPSGIVLPLSLFNFDRKQYNASLVNKFIYNIYKKIIFKNVIVVGIVEGDGYVDNLNFVFGLASRTLRVASVYTYRVKINYREKFRERVAKVVVHEVGHLLGLSHCDNYCVMKFSNSLMELDSKPLEFCTSCRIRIREVLGELDINDES